MKRYCKNCKKVTSHREKGVRERLKICNVCDLINSDVTLFREEDARTLRAGRSAFVEFDESGRGKALHTDPQLNFSCILDPQFGPSYTWMTTVITEILSDAEDGDTRTIKFKTKNSTYQLTTSNFKVETKEE